MKSVFLSFTFRDEDRDFVAEVHRLLASHSLEVVNGRRLGGRLLEPEILRRIRQSDCLVALMTHRVPDPVSGQLGTHPWVHDEYVKARTLDRRCIALVENGVLPPGSTAQYESLFFDRNNRLPALLELSETIREWKRDSGRSVKVRILPEELAVLLGQGNGYRCRYRLWLEGQTSEWLEVNPIPEPGGTFVWLNRVQDGHSVQIEVVGGARRWTSPAQSQWMEIRLQPAQGGM